MARLILLACTFTLTGCGRVWLPTVIEQRVGAAAAQEFLEHARLVEDSPWSTFVQDAGMKLAAVSERPDYGYKFHIIASPDVNAVAFPDGSIFITDGLLRAAGRDTDAVAAVIGHEIGHIARRHGAEGLQSSLGLSALGAALFGVDASIGGAAASLAGSLLVLGYGRDMELEADLCSIRYLARLGHPPDKGLTFLRLIAAKEKEESGGLVYYLRSHPPTAERLDYAQRYAASMTR